MCSPSKARAKQAARICYRKETAKASRAFWTETSCAARRGEIGFDLVELGKGKYRRVFVAGLGKPASANAEALRQAAGAIIKALRKHRLARAALVIPQIKDLPTESAAEALVVGAMLAAFDYEEYRGAGKKKDDDPPKKKFEITIVSEDAGPAKAGAQRGQIIADGQNFAARSRRVPGTTSTRRCWPISPALWRGRPD